MSPQGTSSLTSLRPNAVATSPEGPSGWHTPRVDSVEHESRLCARVTELEASLAAAQAKIANLEAALATNRRIGAALGVMMASRKILEDEAFTALREVSQAHNIKLRDVADYVLLTGDAALSPYARGCALPAAPPGRRVDLDDLRAEDDLMSATKLDVSYDR
jgi:hypothetical protein